MTKDMVMPPNAATSQNGSDEKPKKKVSWLRTILWMFSMALLGNLVMAIIAYFLFFADK